MIIDNGKAVILLMSKQQNQLRQIHKPLKVLVNQALLILNYTFHCIIR